MATKTDHPLPADLEAGKTYSWCSCGSSQNMPLCDGSHKDTDHKPISFVAEETRKTFLCACSSTQIPPICDGSHCFNNDD